MFHNALCLIIYLITINLRYITYIFSKKIKGLILLLRVLSSYKTFILDVSHMTFYKRFNW
jgi:hypothetical protein